MNVKIKSYIPQHSSDSSTHTIVYRVAFDQTINLDQQNISKYGIIYYENTAFTLTETGTTHRFRHNDQCPYLKYALLESWTWSCQSYKDNAGWSAWDCTCTYIAPPIYSSNRLPMDNLISATYVVQKREVVADKAWKDTDQTEPTEVIQTTANEIINSPPLTRSVSDVVISIQKNLAIKQIPGSNTYPILAANVMTTNVDIINSKPITINGFQLTNYQAKIESIQPTVRYFIVVDTNGDYDISAYADTVIKISVNYETFIKKILNAGFKELRNSKQIEIVLQDGSKPQNPVKLDEDGAQTTEPYYLEFRVNKAGDFLGLNLSAEFAPNLESVLYKDND